MRRFIYRIGLSLLLIIAAIGLLSGTSTVFAQPPDDETVSFPDSNLETAVRWAIKKPTGPIYTSDLSSVYYMTVAVNPVSDLTGLEHCVNLHQLIFKVRSDITDISPLAGLSKLSLVYLNSSKISDISPLGGLSELRNLQLTNNRISDISPLANLTNLEELDLSRNRVEDISPLAGLTKLQKLNLSGNLITDISPLANLTNLEELDLSRNSIIDISPLVGLSQLNNLDLTVNRIRDIAPLLTGGGLSVQSPIKIVGNPLNNASLYFCVPMLEETGIRVNISRYTFPDWTFIPASLIAWAGLGYAAIYYLTTGRRWRRLRLAAMVLGVIGAVLMVIWLLPAFISLSGYDVLPISWGVAITLAVVAFLLILAGAVTSCKYELFGSILLIVAGLLTGIVYPLYLFSTWSILTLFPLVSGFLYLLSRRERLRCAVVESGQKESEKHLPHGLLVTGIIVVGPIGLLAVLFYGLSIAFLQSPTTLEQYIFWLLVEVWGFSLTCAILARRKYW